MLKIHKIINLNTAKGKIVRAHTQLNAINNSTIRSSRARVVPSIDVKQVAPHDSIGGVRPLADLTSQIRSPTRKNVERLNGESQFIQAESLRSGSSKRSGSSNDVGSGTTKDTKMSLSTEERVRKYQAEHIVRCSIAKVKLGGKCVDCGVNDLRVLAFDHLDPKTKRWEVSKMRNKSTTDFESEVQKCTLRCHNCHHLKTCEQRRNGEIRTNPKRIKAVVVTCTDSPESACVEIPSQ